MKQQKKKDMLYKIYRREHAGEYSVIMDYNRERSRALWERFREIPWLSYSALYDRRDMDAFVVTTVINLPSLLAESESAQKDKLYDICAQVLGVNDLPYPCSL